MVAQFSHSRGVTTNGNNNETAMGLVHLILGKQDYAKIKTGTRPRVGLGEPAVDYTSLGWTVTSLGTEFVLQGQMQVSPHSTLV